MARITVYKNSILASLCSLMGYGLLVGGVMVVFSGDIFAGIALAAMGLGLAFLAALISEAKRFWSWKRQIKKKGLEDAIRSSTQVAIQVYNTYPCDKAMKYIASLNPTAGRYISQNTTTKK